MGRPLNLHRIEVVDEDVAAILRTKTPAEKIEMIAAAHRTARQLIAGGVRLRHPEWDDEQVHHEVIRRLTHGAN